MHDHDQWNAQRRNPHNLVFAQFPYSIASALLTRSFLGDEEIGGGSRVLLCSAYDGEGTEAPTFGDIRSGPSVNIPHIILRSCCFRVLGESQDLGERGP